MLHPGKRAALFLAFAAATALAQDQTIQFGGTARHFILHAPSGLSKPPVVFVLHGSGMTGAQMVSNTKMDAVADKEKFIAVYPNGINNSWQTAPATDFEFLLAIVDTLDARFHVDRERIYVSGFSQGGVMSYHAACRYADKFAAVAPVSGRIQETCVPKRPIPLLAIFGTSDVLTPAAFMKDLGTIADFDGCPKTAEVTRPYPAGNASSVVTHMVFGPCKNGIEVWADSVKGGPHEWPMDTKTKMNASEEVWGFFKKWTLSGTTGIARREGGAGNGIKAAFAAGKLEVAGAEAGSRIQVFDLRGRLAAASDEARMPLDFRGRPGGVYWVKVEGNGRTACARVAVP